MLIGCSSSQRRIGDGDAAFSCFHRAAVRRQKTHGAVLYGTVWDCTARGTRAVPRRAVPCRAAARKAAAHRPHISLPSPSPVQTV